MIYKITLLEDIDMFKKGLILYHKDRTLSVSLDGKEWLELFEHPEYFILITDINMNKLKIEEVSIEDERVDIQLLVPETMYTFEEATYRLNWNVADRDEADIECSCGSEVLECRNRFRALQYVCPKCRMSILHYSLYMPIYHPHINIGNQDIRIEDNKEWFILKHGK